MRIYSTIIILLLGIAVQAQIAEELLPNGGFEDGLTGWGQWVHPASENNTFETISDEGTVYAGNNALAIGEKVYTDCTLKLEAGKNYAFSYKYKFEEAGDRYPNYKLAIGEQVIVENQDRVFNNGLEWNTRQFGFEIPEGSSNTTLKITFYTWETKTSNIFIDNVSVKEGFPDMQPPTAPDTLIAPRELGWVDDDSIRIAWTPVLDSIGDTVQDPLFYRVLRSNNINLPLEQVATTTDTTYLDLDVSVVKYYYYGISAVDKMGNEGDTSMVIEVFSLPNPWPPVQTSTEDLETGSFSIYPSPADSYINLSQLEPGAQIDLITLSGKTILKSVVKQNNMVIQLDNLKPGIYYIRQSNNRKEITTRKFIKR